MPIPGNDGIQGRNDYDAIFLTLDAYRKEIANHISELADVGAEQRTRILVDYPNQNTYKVNPPELVIMDSLSVIRRRLGGTKTVRQTINPDGQTWTRVTQVGYGRIVFQMDLWARNATERGKIHTALMGLLQPRWELKIGEDAIATLVLQHYRPIREGREDEVARSIYQGFILTPELVTQTLYNVNDIYVGVSTQWPEPAVPEVPTYYPNVHVYDADAGPAPDGA